MIENFVKDTIKLKTIAILLLEAPFCYYKGRFYRSAVEKLVIIALKCWRDKFGTWEE